MADQWIISVLGSRRPRSRTRVSSKRWIVPSEAWPIDSEFPEVDGYEILAELGHGGMGVVYKAYQQRLSRFVASQNDSRGQPGEARRPGPISDRGRGGRQAATPEHHPDLRYRRGRRPAVRCARAAGRGQSGCVSGGHAPARRGVPRPLLATLARAIHAAHQAGIIHRDLKPSNVMFGTDGTPKITDFGLAKRLEEEGYTETGQVLGSPSYIPPEQAQGRAKEVGPAADIYALGAILYEMLTGRPPFKGTTPVETVMQVLNEDPVPPSRLQPQVPRDLETICLKCLAKEPHKRYPTALALADDLDRYLTDRPIQARPTPIHERGLKWVRRRPISSFLLAFSRSVMVFAGLAVWFRSQADLRLKESRIDAGLNQGG